MKSIIKLEKVSRVHPIYYEIRNRHYVANHGCIGRQLHYLIYRNNEPIGIISGASAVWACKPRDDFFSINKENRAKKIGKIINNVVYRIEFKEKNLATRVLSLFRKQVIKDWEERYKDNVVGFETFVFGKNRTGALYKADNWIYCGVTSGSAKYKPHGAYNKGERKTVAKKFIFCKNV